MRHRFLLAAFSFGIALPSRASEPLLDGLRTRYKTEALSVGALLQSVGDFQGRRSAAGQNGFSIANARLSLSGRLDEGFGYLLQGNFISAAPLLDARVSYATPYGFSVDSGLFKTPFSGESQISASSIDFVDRSQAVSAFGTGRSIGVQFRGPVSRYRWAAGVFNGNSPSVNGNDDGDVLAVARLSEKKGSFTGGVSAAFGRDRSVSYGSLLTGFHGRRALAGADLRWRTGALTLSAEGVFANLQPASGAPAIDAGGFHATAGFHFRPDQQVLLRVDSLETGRLRRDSRFLVAGWNFWPTGASEVQVNWLVPAAGPSRFEDQRGQVNFQIGF